MFAGLNRSRSIVRLTALRVA